VTLNALDLQIEKGQLQEEACDREEDEGYPRIDEALLELAQEFRGALLSNETADKITMRILGDKAPAKVTLLRGLSLRT
jgi:hypothetical protein